MSLVRGVFSSCKTNPRDNIPHLTPQLYLDIPHGYDEGEHNPEMSHTKSSSSASMLTRKAADPSHYALRFFAC